MICPQYLAPRKVGLTDAGVRKEEHERTAYIFLPGGLGALSFTMLPLDWRRRGSFCAPLCSELRCPGLIRATFAGTFDEMMELLTLAQLRKLGTHFPVPIIIANFDGMYDGLLALLRSGEKHGCLHADELWMVRTTPGPECWPAEGCGGGLTLSPLSPDPPQVVVCNSTDEIVDYLSEFYQLGPEQDRPHKRQKTFHKARMLAGLNGYNRVVGWLSSNT